MYYPRKKTQLSLYLPRAKFDKNIPKNLINLQTMFSNENQNKIQI